jgi:hypothetical protein
MDPRPTAEGTKLPGGPCSRVEDNVSIARSRQQPRRASTGKAIGANAKPFLSLDVVPEENYKSCIAASAGRVPRSTQLE